MRAGWMTPAVCTTSTVPSRPSNRAARRSGRRMSPTHRLDAGERRRATAASSAVGDERPDRARAGVRSVGAAEVVDEGPAEPAAGAGDDRDVRADRATGSGRAISCARLVPSTKWRALRMATAITDAWGLTPGASGQQRGVVDVHVGRAPHEPEAVGGRRGDPRRAAPSSTGGPSSRWPGRRANVACIVARSARRAHDRRAPVGRVDLGGAGLQHQQGQAGQALRPSSGLVAAGQAVGHERDRAGRARRAPRPDPRW